MSTIAAATATAATANLSSNSSNSSTSSSTESISPLAILSIPFNPNSLDSYLTALFYPSPIPQFPRSTEINSTLISLCSFLSQQSQLAELQIQNNSYRMAEYRSESIRINELLSYIHLSSIELPKSIQLSLQIISKLADLLGFSDSKLSNFAQSTLKLYRSHRKLYELNEKQMGIIDSLNKMNQWINERENEIKQWRKLNQDEINEYNQNNQNNNNNSKNQQYENEIEYFQAKQLEYNKKIKFNQEKYMNTNNNNNNNNLNNNNHSTFEPLPYPNWHDESIIKLSNEFTELNHQLSNIKSELSQYHLIPTNIQLARIKLIESENELKRLELLLDSGVTEMAFNSGRDIDNQYHNMINNNNRNSNTNSFHL